MKIKLLRACIINDVRRNKGWEGVIDDSTRLPDSYYIELKNSRQSSKRTKKETEAS